MIKRYNMEWENDVTKIALRLNPLFYCFNAIPFFCHDNEAVEEDLEHRRKGKNEAGIVGRYLLNLERLY